MSTSKDSTGSFYEFTKVCAKLEREGSHLRKTGIVKQYMETFKGDKYLFFKLMLPGKKSGCERVFHMKDKQIALIFGRICGFDQKDLLRDAEQSGDISQAVKKFFEDSDQAAAKSRVTLRQVDSFLDKLSTVKKEAAQEDVISEFIVNKCTGDDVKYIVRIIKQDLKTYAGAKYLLTALHPDAYAAFVASNNLKDIIERVESGGDELSQLSQSLSQSPAMKVSKSKFDSDSDVDEVDVKKQKQDTKATKKKKKDDSDTDMSDNNNSSSKGKAKKDSEKADKKRKRAESGSEKDSDSDSDKKKAKKKKTETKTTAKKTKKLTVSLNLMTPVKPMLARASKSVDDAIKRCPNGFYTEIKYDGERIQIHKRGDEFKYFSRNLKPVMEHKVREVQSYILKSTDADEIILDGEILLYDTKTGSPLPFGTLGKHKKTRFDGANVAIFLFDILFLNGKSLMNKTMERRREIMEENVKVIPGRILLSEFVKCEGTIEEREESLTKSLVNAINHNLEGLVLKDLQSIYEPNARHWLKIKKDYLTGMADSADLIVLGAYFGSGSKGGLMSVFLMGVYDSSTKTYKTVCKAGNGHDDDTINKLQKQLKPNMKQIYKDASKVPDWLDIGDNHLLPDFVVVDPKKSVVWEISGAEFTESRHHTAEGMSIRFPRVTKIRSDKDVSDATSLKELKKLFEESKKRGIDIAALAKKGKGKAAASTSTTKKRKKDDASDSEEEAKTKKSSAKKAKKAQDSDDSDDDNNSKGKNVASTSILTKPIKKKDVSDDSSSETEKKDKGKKKKEAEKKNIKKESDTEASDNDSDSDFECDGEIKYVKGDITRPTSTGQIVENMCLAHTVDTSGKWSNRGDMGNITTTFGDDPKDKYEASKDLSLGNVETAKISNQFGQGKLYIASLIGQKSTKRGAPPIQYKGLKKAIKKLGEFAKSKNCSVHFAMLNPQIPNMKWEKIELYLLKHLVAQGITTVCYSRNGYTSKRVKKEKKEKDVAPPPPQVEKKQKEEKKPLEGVRVVLAGYSDKESVYLRSMVEDLGGIVGDGWVSFGSRASTHLVCADGTSEEYVHVSNLGGTIVTKAWVEECFTKKKKADEQNFIFKPVGLTSNSQQSQQLTSPQKQTKKKSSSQSQSQSQLLDNQQVQTLELLNQDLLSQDLLVPVVTTTKNTPSKPTSQSSQKSNKSTDSKTQAKTSTANSTPKKSSQNSEPATKPAKSGFELPNLFEGKKVFLHGNIDKKDSLRRYLIGLGAEVFDTYKESAFTHMVTDSAWQDSFDDYMVDHIYDLQIVNSGWVWDTVKDMKLQSESDFLVPRNLD